MATNEELCKLIQSGVDVQSNIESLWLQNTGIVHKLAASYARDSFEAEDLQQEGYFALLKAADHYDPDCGAKFLTYFIIHLNSRMRRYLNKTRSSVSMSVNLVDDISKYQRTRKKLQADLGKDPSDEMICKSMEISGKQLEKIKKASDDFDVVSLDFIPPGNDDSLQIMLADPNDRIEELLYDLVSDQLTEQLWKLVDKLNPREQEIIKEIYLHNKSGAEIGREKGVSNQRINQIKQKAFNKIKKQPESKELLRMAMDVYGIAVHGTSLAAFQRTWTSATERAAIKLYEREKENKEAYLPIHKNDDLNGRAAR